MGIKVQMVRTPRHKTDRVESIRAPLDKRMRKKKTCISYPMSLGTRESLSNRDSRTTLIKRDWKKRELADVDSEQISV